LKVILALPENFRTALLSRSHPFSPAPPLAPGACISPRAGLSGRTNRR
jgi:hypothetical protein